MNQPPTKEATMNPHLIVSAARLNDSGAFEYVEIPVSLTDNTLVCNLIAQGWMTWFVQI